MAGDTKYKPRLRGLDVNKREVDIDDEAEVEEEEVVDLQVKKEGLPSNDLLGDTFPVFSIKEFKKALLSPPFTCAVCYRKFTMEMSLNIHRDSMGHWKTNVKKREINKGIAVEKKEKKNAKGRRNGVIEEGNTKKTCPLCKRVYCHWKSLITHCHVKHQLSSAQVRELECKSKKSPPRKIRVDESKKERMSRRWHIPLNVARQIEVCPMKCPVCITVYRNYSCLRVHYCSPKGHGSYSELHDNDPFLLLANEKDVTRLRKMQKGEEKPKRNGKNVICPQCKKNHNSMGSLILHCRETHGISAAKLRQQLKSLEEKGKKGVKQSDKTNGDLMGPWNLPPPVHHETQSCAMRCPTCSKVYSNFNSLRYHYAYGKRHGHRRDLVAIDPLLLLAKDDDIRRIREIASQYQSDISMSPSSMDDLYCPLCEEDVGPLETVELFKDHAVEAHPLDFEWMVEEYEIRQEKKRNDELVQLMTGMI